MRGRKLLSVILPSSILEIVYLLVPARAPSSAMVMPRVSRAALMRWPIDGVSAAAFSAPIGAAAGATSLVLAPADAGSWTVAVVSMSFMGGGFRNAGANPRGRARAEAARQAVACGWFGLGWRSRRRWGNQKNRAAGAGGRSDACTISPD